MGQKQANKNRPGLTGFIVPCGNRKCGTHHKIIECLVFDPDISFPLGNVPLENGIKASDNLGSARFRRNGYIQTCTIAGNRLEANYVGIQSAGSDGGIEL